MWWHTSQESSDCTRLPCVNVDVYNSLSHTTPFLNRLEIPIIPFVCSWAVANNSIHSDKFAVFVKRCVCLCQYVFISNYERIILWWHFHQIFIWKCVNDMCRHCSSLHLFTHSVHGWAWDYALLMFFLQSFSYIKCVCVSFLLLPVVQQACANTLAVSVKPLVW